MMLEKIGRYKILELIGSGSMGNVYRAHDDERNEDVAIKVLRLIHVNNEVVKRRFLREGRTIVELEHPAVVRVYEIDQDGEFIYFVMPLMLGKSLANKLENGQRLEIEQIATIIRRIGAALDAVHEKGIIHRDVKPHNILFDSDDKPYLADFSILKADTSADGILITKTGLGQMLGTPAYISPEIVNGALTLDYRSDLYALGIVFFELLAGQLPYQANTPLRTAILHEIKPIPLAHRVDRTLAPQWQTVINKALAKNRDERYQSGAAFSQAVQDTIQLLRLLSENSYVDDPSLLEPEDSLNSLLTHYHEGEVDPFAIDDLNELEYPLSNSPAPPPQKSKTPTTPFDLPVLDSTSNTALPRWLKWFAFIVMLLTLSGALYFITGGSDPQPTPTTDIVIVLSVTPTDNLSSTDPTNVDSLETSTTSDLNQSAVNSTTSPSEYSIPIECADSENYAYEIMGLAPELNTRLTDADGPITLIYNVEVKGLCPLNQVQLYPIRNGNISPTASLSNEQGEPVTMLRPGTNGNLILEFEKPEDVLYAKYEWGLMTLDHDQHRVNLSSQDHLPTFVWNINETGILNSPTILPLATTPPPTTIPESQINTTPTSFLSPTSEAVPSSTAPPTPTIKPTNTLVVATQMPNWNATETARAESIQTATIQAQQAQEAQRKIAATSTQVVKEASWVAAQTQEAQQTQLTRQTVIVTETSSPTLPACVNSPTTDPEGDADGDGKKNKDDSPRYDLDPCNPDTDGDGFGDNMDLCPSTFGTDNGCPGGNSNSEETSPPTSTSSPSYP